MSWVGLVAEQWMIRCVVSFLLAIGMFDPFEGLKALLIGRLSEPFCGDQLVSVGEAVLLAPRAIGGLGCLADRGGRAGEHEPDVEVRVLLLNEDHLLSISDHEAA